MHITVDDYLTLCQVSKKLRTKIRGRTDTNKSTDQISQLAVRTEAAAIFIASDSCIDAEDRDKFLTILTTRLSY